MKISWWKSLDVAAMVAVCAVVFRGLLYLRDIGTREAWYLPPGFAAHQDADVAANVAGWTMLILFSSLGFGGLAILRKGQSPEENRTRMVIRMYFVPLVIALAGTFLVPEPSRWKWKLILAGIACVGAVELWRWLKRGKRPVAWGILLPATLLMLPLMYYFAGKNGCLSAVEFMVLTDAPDRVILAMKDDSMVVAPFDRANSILRRQREVIRFADHGSAVRYATERIGPLKVE